MLNIKSFASILMPLAIVATTLVGPADAQAQTAQDGASKSSAVSRRAPASRGSKKQQEAEKAPQVTDRMQAHYDDDAGNITDADRQWMRVIYRHIDLDKDQNAPLYFPEEAVDGQENLFRIIMRLLANNQITAYEYLDGREIFTDKYQMKVRDLLDRFHIPYTNAKGSTEKNPRFVIDESDVPTNEVLSYYAIERWEFDSRHNRMRTVVEAICPVLHRSGDFGGEAVKYPMFWVKYADIKPWLAQQTIFTSDDNNLPTCTYDDFFNLTMYQGDIYKTRNLKNRSMMQLYPDPDAMRAAQDSIQNRLDTFEEKLWVPDREDVIAKKDNKKTEASANKEADSPEADVEAATAAGDSEKSTKRNTKRSTKRSAAPKKETKVKETKASKSSSATRSVRRRK